MRKPDSYQSLFSVIIFGALIFLTNSCALFRSNLYESFYVGNEGTQYFIKPLKFSNSSSEKLLADITFRFNNQIASTDTAHINFSLISNDLVKTIDSLKFSNANHHFITTDVKRLFMERDNKQYLTRFSASVPLHDLTNLFSFNEWSIVVFHKQKTITFSQTSSAARKIESLNHNLIELIR